MIMVVFITRCQQTPPKCLSAITRAEECVLALSSEIKTDDSLLELKQTPWLPLSLDLSNTMKAGENKKNIRTVVVPSDNW